MERVCHHTLRIRDIGDEFIRSRLIRQMSDAEFFVPQRLPVTQVDDFQMLLLRELSNRAVQLFPLPTT